MEIQSRITLIKSIMFIFILLNILSLTFGYYLIEDKFSTINNSFDSQILNLERKKVLIVENVNILSQSKEDINSNILLLKSKKSSIETNINDSKSTFISNDDEKSYYSNKLNTLKNEQANLLTKKTSLQNQLEIKKQKIADAKRVIIRRTRSS